MCVIFCHVLYTRLQPRSPRCLSWGVDFSKCVVIIFCSVHACVYECILLLKYYLCFVLVFLDVYGGVYYEG